MRITTSATSEHRKTNKRLRNKYMYIKKYVSNGRCSCCDGIYDTDELQIHHIDGNFRNNSKSNLSVMCGVCHEYIHSIENRKIREEI